MVADNSNTLMQHSQKLLRACLGRVQAMDLEQLGILTGLERNTLLQGLEKMVASGEVEVLRPLPAASHAAPVEDPSYRLIRETDDDYAWQQDLVVRLPPHRVELLGNMEGPATSMAGGRKTPPQALVGIAWT